jgi:hypothetical protein
MNVEPRHRAVRQTWTLAERVESCPPSTTSKTGAVPGRCGREPRASVPNRCLGSGTSRCGFASGGRLATLPPIIIAARQSASGVAGLQDGQGRDSLPSSIGCQGRARHHNPTRVDRRQLLRPEDGWVSGPGRRRDRTCLACAPTALSVQRRPLVLVFVSCNQAPATLYYQ